MRIAVTYENGNVFQHFGHSEYFKLYEVQDNEVVATGVIGTDGQGHGALSHLLYVYQIDVLICGGIGPGAQSALSEVGIALYPGVSGSCDSAVEAYLRGELVQTGANCNHHHEDGHSCGDHGCGSHGCGDHNCCH